MSTPEPANQLPLAAITQCLQQLNAVANVLAPTAEVEALCESDDALQHTELMQYVTGTEHLNLAIAYLEMASGVVTAVSTANFSESLGFDPEPGYGRYSVREVEVVREQTQPDPE